jgi:hypothetical protein
MKKINKNSFKSTFFKANFIKHLLYILLFWFSNFFGIAYQGEDIVFRFIIECNSLMNFGPQVVGLFLCEDF